MSRVVLDTDVVIAALDAADPSHARAGERLRAFADERAELLISSVNYAEALVRPAETDHGLRTAVNAIASLGMRVVEPEASVARSAARLRSRLNVGLADCFALATALAEEAAIGSFDTGVGKAAESCGIDRAA